jgi:hypothetical protein
MYKVPLFSWIPAFAHWRQVKENNSFEIIINFQLFQQKSQGLKPIKKRPEDNSISSGLSHGIRLSKKPPAKRGGP